MANQDTPPDFSTCRGCGAHIPANEQRSGRHPYLCYFCSRTPSKREQFGGPNGDGHDPRDDVPPTQGRWRASVSLRGGADSVVAACDTHRAACEALADHVETLPKYVVDRIHTTKVTPAGS